MYSMGIPYNCFILATVILISARYGECLHCFQCQNVSEGVDCNVVVECNNDESCYIERFGPVNDTRSSLGCMPRQNCPTEHQFTMVGRSVQTQCKTCCSVDGCNKRYCGPIQHAVHGGWGTWAHWSPCSSSCGQGITRRTRVCDNPRPQLLGNFCFGDSNEYGMCLIKPCPIDGEWTDWSFWSGCSVTCGDGHAIRQRSCSNPTPTYGGLTCPESRTEQKTCHIANCPVNGGWSTWTSWSFCSSLVARGLSKRQRTCTNPTPSSLGRGCIGDSTEQRPCPGVISAFTVYYPAADLSLGTIRFTRVITNIGGHYNTSTGIFTCQYPGIYVFALHIMKNAGSNDAYCDIRKNGSNVVLAWTDPASNSDSGYYSSTNSVVVHLVHGDKVNLEGCSPIDNLQYSGTTFSGFLLSAD